MLKGELGRQSHAYSRSHRSKASLVVELVEDLPTGPFAYVEHDSHRHFSVDSRRSSSHAITTTLILRIDIRAIHYSTKPSGASLSTDAKVQARSPIGHLRHGNIYSIQGPNKCIKKMPSQRTLGVLAPDIPLDNPHEVYRLAR